MSDEKRQKFLQWLNSHRPGHWALSCPCCGGGNWEVGDVVELPVRPPPSGIFAGLVKMVGRKTPVAQLVCSRCCYTMSFAARPIGLVE